MTTTTKTLEDTRREISEHFVAHAEDCQHETEEECIANDIYFAEMVMTTAYFAALDACREKLDGMDEQNHITQAILGALEYRGFYDAGKYLDGSIWEHAKPLLLEAIDSLRIVGGKEN